MPPLTTPVVFLVFNRPDCTARSLAAIRAARPARLYVVADGPRADRPADAARCAEVRALVERGVDWPCEVVRDYAPANLGLARRVASGLDAVFAREQEAIILEDDCIPDPTFFPFCAELLARYRGNEQVAQITGCSFQAPGQAWPASYYFSRYPHCWGWATWRRAWRHYDPTMGSWREFGGSIFRWMESAAERRYWNHSFAATAAGRIDSWAYRWTASLWSQSRLCLTPYRNLISNVGFSPDATHTQETTPLAGLPVTPMAFPLVHPGSPACDTVADAHTSRLVYRRPSWPARALRRLRRLLARRA